MRHVKGSLFVDYVRMLRARKDIEWSTRLPRGDVELLRQTIDEAAWYPMDTFERYGLQILDTVAFGEVELVRAWGQASADVLVKNYPDLLAVNDPRETLMRFHVLRRTFFDFEAIDLRSIDDVEARLHIAYHMSPLAEEAASFQAMGFFERLLEMAGASEIHSAMPQRSWRGDSITLLSLKWSSPL